MSDFADQVPFADPEFALNAEPGCTCILLHDTSGSMAGQPINELNGPNLRGADLREANISEANLSSAGLSRALLNGANPEGAGLGGANMDGA